ncbi:MAG: type II/IV secretion system ATPase subunit [Candidatus Thermoplasmatota archaeon]|nr:type II/IV secretion system ATPase subunit [Candidatus Thermoplasmatota archaeon]
MPSNSIRWTDVFIDMMKRPKKIVGAKGSFLSETEFLKIDVLDPEKFDDVETYSIREPYSFAKIVLDRLNYEYVYMIIEPSLSESGKNLLETLKLSLAQVMAVTDETLNSREREEYIKEGIKTFVQTRDLWVDEVTRKKLEYYLIRDFLGYSIIDPLMKDKNIEDISCDGINVPIYIYHRKYENMKTNLRFPTGEALNSFIVYLGQKGKKQVSVSDPILDASSPEGNRINATFGDEVTARGGTFTIRLFRETPFTPTDLVISKTASPELVAYMWLTVEFGQNMMILGGTGAGKTSTLNALTLFIPPTAKIVSIEDTREINLPHQNWIPSTTRSGVGERGYGTGKSAGEIDMFDLVRAALRQRPNYIIVGEVRGREAYNLFQAMATGHVTYATMHADSLRSMVSRLENQPINIPRIMMTSLNNVSIQMQVRVRDQMVRRIKELVEIVGYDPDTNELTLNTIFSWNMKTDKIEFMGHSYLFEKIMDLKNIDQDEMDEEFKRRVDVIRYLAGNRITDYITIWQYITDYYRNPMRTIENVRKEMEEKAGLYE